MRVRVTTKGGRPARDHIFKRNIEQENARKNRPITDEVKKITFGKYKGISITDIESDYLLWCSENLDKCPSYITDELKYRGYNPPDDPPWEDRIH